MTCCTIRRPSRPPWPRRAGGFKLLLLGQNPTKVREVPQSCSLARMPAQSSAERFDAIFSPAHRQSGLHPVVRNRTPVPSGLIAHSPKPLPSSCHDSRWSPGSRGRENRISVPSGDQSSGVQCPGCSREKRTQLVSSVGTGTRKDEKSEDGSCPIRLAERTAAFYTDCSCSSTFPPAWDRLNTPWTT